MDSFDIKASGLKTIELEASAIAAMKAGINDDFEKAVKIIAANKGRLVVSGIGKSAIIAQKIVATLNSTGTPSIFLHAADAIHGDLGMIQQDDVVMIISKSGESPEIKVLIPFIKNFGNTVIGMSGNSGSFLATQSDISLDTSVSHEACPNNLAPTSSTTAQLVMGDAMAVALMEMKGFGSKEFAKFHPGGTLGKKLYLRVDDLYKKNENPSVQPESGIKSIIISISQGRLGATAVINENEELLGVITDGDIRRMLESSAEIKEVKASEIMTKTPKYIEPSALAVNALDIMRQYDITQLMVAENNRYLGMVHLHDLIKEGLV